MAATNADIFKNEILRINWRVIFDMVLRSRDRSSIFNKLKILM